MEKNQYTRLCSKKGAFSFIHFKFNLKAYFANKRIFNKVHAYMNIMICARYVFSRM